MLQPHGILEASLYVSDIARADEFYSRVLRLASIRKKIEREVAYRLGETVLILFRPDATRQQTNFPPHSAEGTGHLAFRVCQQDIEAWLVHLQTCGVEIEKDITWPRGGRSIYFRDPDGNCVELATANVWPDPLSVAK